MKIKLEEIPIVTIAFIDELILNFYATTGYLNHRKSGFIEHHLNKFDNEELSIGLPVCDLKINLPRKYRPIVKNEIQLEKTVVWIDSRKTWKQFR